jgi:hypothetical protein
VVNDGEEDRAEVGQRNLRNHALRDIGGSSHKGVDDNMMIITINCLDSGIP